MQAMFPQRLPYTSAALLIVRALSTAAADTIFTSNPTSNSTGSPEWRVGDTVKITWTSSFNSTNVGYIHSLSQDSFYTILRAASPEVTSYEWVVDVNASSWNVGSESMYLGLQDASANTNSGETSNPLFSPPFMILPASAPAPTLAAGNSSQPADSSQTSGSSIPVGAVAGAAIGGFTVAGALVALFFVFRRKRRERKRATTTNGAARWQGHEKRPSAGSFLGASGKPRDDKKAKKVQWMDDDEGYKPLEKKLPTPPPDDQATGKAMPSQSGAATPSTAPIPDYQISLLGPDGEPVSELHGESRLVSDYMGFVRSRDDDKPANKVSPETTELPAAEPLISPESRSVARSPWAGGGGSAFASPEVGWSDARHGDGAAAAAAAGAVGEGGSSNWGSVSPPTSGSPWLGGSVVADEETGQFYRIVSPRMRGARYQQQF